MDKLVLDKVGKRYKKDRWGLRDVSLHMETGIWGLVGPNGAGKTTFLRMVASLLSPTQGSVFWRGQNIYRSPRLLRQELGYVPQDFGVYPQLTAHQYLRVIGSLKGLRGNLLNQRIDLALHTVRLEEVAHRHIAQYSGGMIRRVGIAQAILNEPSLLVLDEPTAGLDPTERIRFRELLTSLYRDRLVILSTHIMADVETIATQLVLLQGGNLVWSGSPNQLSSTATGMVWAVSLSEAEFLHVRTHFEPSSAVQQGAQIAARFVTSAQPHPTAELVPPTLEEGYLFLTGVNGGKPQSSHA